MFKLCTRTYVPGTTILVSSLYGSDEMTAVVATLGDVASAVQRVGSRVTCSPPPVDTDEDWLMLIDSNPAAGLKAMGFTQDGSPQFYTGSDAGSFRSWRRGDLNIVTTPDRIFYGRFLTATHLAQRFNLLDKQDRIALFQAILYGVDVRNLEQSRTMVEPVLLPSAA
jgi:hypothetical protein